MKTLTPEQFKQKYGEVGMAQFNQKSKEKNKEPTLKDRLANTGNKMRDRINENIQGSSDKSLLNRGVNATAAVAGGVLGGAYDLSPKPVRQALDFVGDKVKQGFESVTDKISDTELFRGAAQGDTSKLEDRLGILTGLGEIAGTIIAADVASKTLQTGTNITKNVVNKLNTPKTPPPPEAPGTPNKTSAAIMDRVARLKPTDATKFKAMTGKTHGQYLADTGNFGTPDKIIQKEAVKFTNSLNEVDNSLAQLPGRYQSAPILEALKGLVEKTKTQSSGTVKAPFYGDVASLVNKYKTGGLTHSEINLLKRLYEKNVKLGYNKLINADGVAKATNIDTALRKWQVQQAKTQGFKNIDALNKQTQASKFIINKLGDQVVGQSGLNSLGLTDWIMLSGGDPTAVAGFLTKKFFSSKSVQAKIAEIMRTAESTKPIKADIGQSEIKQLSAPKEGSISSQNNVAPKLPTRRLPDEKGVKNTKQR